MLACSGSIALPRLCHQRTLMSCQRSIAARRSLGLGHVPQLDTSVVEPAHVAPQVLAALARQVRQVLVERLGQLDPRVGRGLPGAHPQPGLAQGCFGTRTQRASRPAAARATRRTASGSRLRRPQSTASRAAGNSQHVPVVRRRAPELRQHAERPAPMRRRAAPVRRGGRRRARSRSKGRRSPTSAATTRVPTPQTRTASPRGPTGTARPIPASSGSSGRGEPRCAPPRRRWPAASARVPAQARHPQPAVDHRLAAEQEARERVAGRPRGAGGRLW